MYCSYNGYHIKVLHLRLSSNCPRVLEAKNPDHNIDEGDDEGQARGDVIEDVGSSVMLLIVDIESSDNQ